jgi:cellulose synthase/poly-beta-1,6-N-acetylglucosamine synthase-like glycosyltransferase
MRDLFLALSSPVLLATIGALLFLWRLAPLRRAARRSGLATADGSRTVSVIVPARNEAHNLPALLGSLAALDRRPDEILVVDDGSTDDTAAIARAAGAKVLSPPPLPAGWAGKPWACATGARAARGELLLFTDADTVHGPGSLGAAIAALEEGDADLVSVVPSHLAVSSWERLQGIFQLLLLVATRAGAFVGRRAPAARGERAFCIGQYLLFRRAAYEALGGHDPVRARVAEDLAFCRLVRARGGRYRLLARPGLLGVRMYPEGLRGFVAGWRRNFREGIGAAGLTGALEITALIGWLLGLPIALVAAFASGRGREGLVLLALYAATAALVAAHQPLVGRFSRRAALAYPLFAGLFVLVSALAALDALAGRPIVWKGRNIPRQAAAPDTSP